MTEAYHELQIAEDLALPLDAVTETFGIYARRGMGKTHTASVLMEEMLTHGAQVVILDPMNVWWGLRSSADGDRPGFPIPILGGNHGDLPLEPGGAATIADVVVERRLAVILSLRHLSKTQQRQFVTAFCERLYDRKGEEAHQGPLHLVIDEADLFAPQRVAAGQERMIGAIDDIVRRGRSSGLGATLITQRPAVLHNDVRTQVEVLVALRLISPHDRKAVDEWIRAHDVHGQREEFMASLAGLPVGTAWFWSPGWLDLFQRVRVRPRRTFDSSRTPKVGKVVEPPRVRAEVDVAALRQALAAVVEQAERDDPAALRRRIAALERQLRERPAAPPETVTVVERVEVPAIDGNTLIRLRAATDAVIAAGEEWGKVGREIAAALDRTTSPPPPPPVPAHSVPPQPAREARETAAGVPDGRLSAPQGRVLDTLARFAVLGMDAPRREHVALLAGASPLSSAYGNNLGHLRSLGLVDYPAGGRLALTDAGRQRAVPVAAPPTLAELHAAWLRIVGPAQGRILRAVIERHPRPVARDELARTGGASPTSSAYGNNLGRLRSLGLIDYPAGGQVAATPLLFPDGLR